MSDPDEVVNLDLADEFEQHKTILSLENLRAKGDADGLLYAAKKLTELMFQLRHANRNLMKENVLAGCHQQASR